MTLTRQTRCEIQKLELKAGDLVAIKTDIPLTKGQVRELRDGLKAVVPDGVDVIVVSMGVTLEVTKAEDRTP